MSAPVLDAPVDAPEVPDLGLAISVDSFSGPLDLLLFLVRKDELDIRDIPLAGIADQFVTLVREWQERGELDLELAGDFILMAATLIEIKARAIAPPPEVEGEEGADDGEDELLDPRQGLITKLLAYRRFKEATGLLTTLEEERAQRHTRRFREELPEDPDEAAGIDLGELDSGMLFGLWDDLLKRLGGKGPRTVLKDDIPLEATVERLVAAAREAGQTRLSALMAQEPGLLGRVTLLMATLETARKRVVEAKQLEQYGEVDLRFRPEEERTAPPPELPPEVPWRKRQRKPPLVTYTGPVSDGPDVDEEPEAPYETDEQRFLRELNEACDLDGVLARVVDVESGFLEHWYTLFPDKRPVPEAVPVAEAPVAPVVVETPPVVEAPPVARATAPPVVEAPPATPTPEPVPEAKEVVSPPSADVAAPTMPSPEAPAPCLPAPEALVPYLAEPVAEAPVLPQPVLDPPPVAEAASVSEVPTPVLPPQEEPALAVVITPDPAMPEPEPISAQATESVVTAEPVEVDPPALAATSEPPVIALAPVADDVASEAPAADAAVTVEVLSAIAGPVEDEAVEEAAPPALAITVAPPEVDAPVEQNLAPEPPGHDAAEPPLATAVVPVDEAAAPAEVTVAARAVADVQPLVRHEAEVVPEVVSPAAEPAGIAPADAEALPAPDTAVVVDPVPMPVAEESPDLVHAAPVSVVEEPPVVVATAAPAAGVEAPSPAVPPVPVLPIAQESPAPAAPPMVVRPPATIAPLLFALAFAGSAVLGWWTFRVPPTVPAVVPAASAAMIVPTWPPARDWFALPPGFLPEAAYAKPWPPARDWWVIDEPLLPATAFLPRPPAPRLTGFGPWQPVPLGWWAVDGAWGWLAQATWAPTVADWTALADLRLVPVSAFAADDAWTLLVPGR